MVTNFRTASELADGIRGGEYSSAEVVEEYLQQIAKHNPALRAIATLDADGARRRAAEADAALARGELWGPLHGVPVTVKDVFETRGLRTTSSFKPLANCVPDRDATVVARLRDAGAVILGKSNMPALGLDLQGKSPLFGRANNPWDLARTAGGSTSGGAAAVAAGLSPLEMGSDLAGSIRLPAHFCGVFGFKPTESAVSVSGHIPPLPGAPRCVRHMLCAGPLARSVADLRLAFSVSAGPDQRHWEVPPVVFAPLAAPDLLTCRIAWSDDFGGLPISAETRAALEKLVNDLAGRGCRVERRNPPEFDFELALRTWGEIAGAEIGASMAMIPRAIALLQLRLMPGGSPLSRGLLGGVKMSMRRFMKALDDCDALTAALENFLSDWDAWLCPAGVAPAFRHCRRGQRLQVDQHSIPYLMGLAFTAVFNVTGSPAVVMPTALSADGLPIGVQLVGRRWHDMELLAVAEAVSAVTGPCPRPPGY